MRAAIHQDFNRERLSPHFVYESFDPDPKLFFNRNSVGFVLEGWPLVGATIQAQNEISEFLKEEDNLPAGASLQILMYGSSQIEHYLMNWASFRQEGIFSKLAEQRCAVLKNKALNDGIIKDVILLIALTIPKYDAQDFSIADLNRRRDILKATFRSIGLLVEDVDDERLINLIRLFFGWEQNSHSVLNPYEILAEQILRSDFSMLVEEENLTVKTSAEKKAIVCLEAVKRPELWRLSLMDLFLGNELKRGEQIRPDFMLHFGIQMLQKQTLELSNAIAKRESLMRNLKSGLTKWLPGLESEYRDMDSAVMAMQAGDRAVIISQNVVLKDVPDKIKARVFEYRSLMRRSGFHFVPTTADHLPVLLSCLPMQLVEEKPGFNANIGGLGPELHSLGRGIKTLSGEAKALLPIVGEWKGDLRSPGMLLVGRRGQLMYWSPFGRVLIPQEGKVPQSNENFNLCIAGVPGSGKSVFMQELMLSTLGVGGRVFVLDYGRSFKRAAALLEGSYIEFSLKNPMSLNPFSEVPTGEHEFEAREDALSGVASVIATMAAPIAGTNDLQNAILQKALRAVWEKRKNRAEITDIANWLLRCPEGYAQDLGNMLFPFTKDGIYGKFFSGPASLSLQHKLVVIETDHLRNVPALLTVVVQMMIIHINQVMVKGDRKFPFLIMIDEAWKLLQGKASGAFIEEMGRIARKYKGSITLATQQLTDYFKADSPAAEKAFENASFKAILKQNPDSLWALRANPKLAAFVREDWQLELLQSIHSDPPHYSEVALFGPDVNGVVARLILDPFTSLLTSTNAEDYQALEDRVNRGMSVTDAISEVLKARGLFYENL